MQLRKRSTVVEAAKINSKFTLETPDGTVMKGEPGDLLITEQDGSQYICKHQDVFSRFESNDGVPLTLQGAAAEQFKQTCSLRGKTPEGVFGEMLAAWNSLSKIWKNKNEGLVVSTKDESGELVEIDLTKAL